MAGETHYNTLKVPRMATMAEIKTSHRKILLANHPDKTLSLGPFARSQANKCIRAANSAWEVLSDAVQKQEYDVTLPHLDPNGDPWRPSPDIESDPPEHGSSSPEPGIPRSSGYGFSYDNDQEADDETDDSDGAPECKEAEYRFMQTASGTVVDIRISEWRLSLFISSKFKAMNNVIEPSIPAEGPENISFEISLQRDRASSETREPTINELTISAESVPDGLHVRTAQMLFKETPNCTSLIVTITAGACVDVIDRIMPWKSGLNFDMNDHPEARNRSRGTCMILSVNEPSTQLRTGRGLDTPECALKWDEQLNANTWCLLGDDRVMKLKYDRCRDVAARSCGVQDWLCV